MSYTDSIGQKLLVWQDFQQKTKDTLSRCGPSFGQLLCYTDRQKSLVSPTKSGQPQCK